ncbi:MAG TPA: hypothetical protein DHV38_10760 [Corynebacterium casei]|nr:hypothetical protein [Corynebacterium casei]
MSEDLLYEIKLATATVLVLSLLTMSVWLIFRAKMHPIVSVLWILVILYTPVLGPLVLFLYLWFRRRKRA